jgi:hypothetical protein
MANFWGNSSSQYIAEKIIRPDFCAIPRRTRRIMNFIRLSSLVRFW